MRKKIGLIIFTLVIFALACNFPGIGNIPIPTSTVSPQPQPVESQIPSSSPSPILLTNTPSPQVPVGSPTPVPTTNYLPVFEPDPCRFPIPQGTQPECGDLVVPEDRLIPDSSNIRLHVAIFRSYAEGPNPDPVIYLAGGPGGSALGVIDYLFSQGFSAILDRRDVIVFDQRGTGYSQPALNCPERDALTPIYYESGLPIDQNRAEILDAFTRCRDRLQNEGINLSAYNSAASAADINDLRLALGYDKVNLYGDSYGTRLALTVMRDFPGGLRSVILDSVYPLQVNLYTSLAANADRSFNSLFDHYAADPACNSVYPDLRAAFYNLVDRLNSQPASIQVADPINSDYHTVHLTGNLLMEVLFTGMYNRDVTASMPAMLYQASRGNYAILSRRLTAEMAPENSIGMQMSVQCREEVPFSSPDDLQKESEAITPQIASFFPASLLPFYDVCPIWGAGNPDPRENQPVSSDIPALILAGDTDPITPPAWGKLAAATLSNSYYYEFSGVGHWVARSSVCSIGMIQAFLDDPSIPPDSTCIDRESGIKFIH